MSADTNGMPSRAKPATSVPPRVLRVPGTGRAQPSGARPAAPRLWDAASGRFDPTRLREAIVGRGWTVPDFVVPSRVSRSTLYNALGGYAVGDRIVIRILAALESRAPTHLLDD